MAGPLDAITAIHNAFRRDIANIDKAALDGARGKPGPESAIERSGFFNEVLTWHARGEELAIFPALEVVAPSVAEAYALDHRGLDAAFGAPRDAASARDSVETARATAAFKFHLDIHLDKEDSHLYRLVRERVPAQDQGQALSLMASTVPQDRFPELIEWMLPLLNFHDRETITRTWQMVMPAEAFAAAVQLIRRVVGDDWADLNRRIPDLSS